MYADGFITLGGYYPSDFPAFVPRVLKTTQVPIVAPYFADADPSKSGKIYFRVTSDPSLLERAAKDVEYVFSHDKFSPEQLLIATWEDVGYYHKHDDRVSSTCMSNHSVSILRHATLKSIIIELYCHSIVCNYLESNWSSKAI